MNKKEIKMKRTPKKKSPSKRRISPCRSPIVTRSRSSKTKCRSPKRSPKKSPKRYCVAEMISKIDYCNYYMDVTCEQKAKWAELKELVLSVKHDYLSSQLKIPEHIPNCAMLEPTCEDIKYAPDSLTFCVQELAQLENVMENIKELLSIIWIYENINITIEYNEAKYKGENLLAIGGEGIVISALGISPCNKNQEFIIKMSPYHTFHNDTSQDTNTLCNSKCALAGELEKLACVKGIKGVIQPVTPMITFENEDFTVYAVVFPRYGPTLSQLQKYENFTFTAEFCKWITQQIMMILGRIHRKGFIHLDVNPANILLGPYNHSEKSYEPQLYLIDFGISQKSNDITFDLGTVKYSSPYISERAVNYKDDYISLIFTVWYLKNGYLPWMEDTNTYEIMRKKKDFLESGVFKEDTYLQIL